MINQNLKILVGDGCDIDFWNDDWTGSGSLKMYFPRIFVLAVVKSGLVSNIGRWKRGRWKWVIELRIMVFDWETQI